MAAPLLRIGQGFIGANLRPSLFHATRLETAHWYSDMAIPYLLKVDQQLYRRVANICSSHTCIVRNTAMTSSVNHTGRNMYRATGAFGHSGRSLYCQMKFPSVHLSSNAVFGQNTYQNRLFFSTMTNRTIFQKSNTPHEIIRHKLASDQSKQNTTALIYVCAIGIFMVGMAYAGVPLYRIFCQATGLGGQAVQGHDSSKVETMVPVKDRLIRIRFNADIASSMQWNFRPQQSEVRVIPGETALAFYTATNPTDKPIVGISTYNVVPFEAGLYFNKIQCFCFEEQRLNPHEQVDMPVFFFIDPEFAEDPKLMHVEEITLSYTFFEAKEGLQLPLPGYMTAQPQ